jgi:hypothetical protein
MPYAPKWGQQKRERERDQLSLARVIIIRIIISIIRISISIYGSTALVDLSRLFSFLINTQSVGLLVISPSQGRYLHTE